MLRPMIQNKYYLNMRVSEFAMETKLDRTAIYVAALAVNDVDGGRICIDGGSSCTNFVESAEAGSSSRAAMTTQPAIAALPSKVTTETSVVHAGDVAATPAAMRLQSRSRDPGLPRPQPSL